MKANRCKFVGTKDLFRGRRAKWAQRRSLFAAGTISVLAVGAALLGAFPLSAQENPKSMVTRATGFAVSAPLRDLAKLPPEPLYSSGTPEPIRDIRSQPAGPVVDTVQQTQLTPASNYTVGLSFLGIGNGFPNYTVTSYHPIPSIAVSDTQLVQWAQESIVVFDKASGTPLTGIISSSQLFQGLSPCDQGGLFPGIIKWDKSAHRWMLTTNRNLPAYTCIAISTSADATGSYFLYAYQQGTFEARLGVWGVWAHGYYKSQAEFQGTVYQGPRLCAYERAKLLAGDPSAQEICFQMAATDSFNPQAADVDSSVPPPSGQDEMFFGLWDASHLSLYTVHPDFANPQNSFATGINGSQLVEVPAFTLACNGNGLFFVNCVPQPGTNNLLQSFGILVDTRVAYWDDNPPLHATATPPLPAPLQHWYVVHDSTADGGIQAPRWYEFTAPQRITPPSGIHLFQSGTYAPDGKHRWISSIARDKKHNILLGYNVSSSNTFASIAIAGRTLQDPLGTLENEVTVINGNGSQLVFPDWGDYSDMRIDPDGCTFWYTNQYYMTTALRNWSTQIASARFSNCN
jgi:hypothetical protein